MELKIDPEFLKANLQEALLLSLPQEVRNEMFKAAIENLVTPRKSSHYSSTPAKSELQEIYDRCISQAVNEIVRDEIRDNPAIKEDILKAIKPYEYKDYDRQRVILEAIVNALLEYHSN